MADNLPTDAAGGDLGIPGATVAPEAPAMSMADAATRKDAFLADKEKTAALLNGDVSATAEWRLITQHLWQPTQSTNPRDDVTQHLQESSGYQLSDEVLQEFRENRASTPEEYRMAQQRLESRKQNPEWLAKYFRGDHEARREVALINSILSRPLNHRRKLKWLSAFQRSSCSTRSSMTLRRK